MGMKILIIKLGYSETLDAEINRIPSIGDVLRTTPILWAIKEKYPDSQVTWLVDSQAEPLLRGNRLIDRLLVWDEFVPFQLMKEKFDVLINLEKIAGICAISDMIDAWVKYGFRFDAASGAYHAYERGLDFIEYIEHKKKTNNSRECWQKVLIEMMGVDWKAQEYIIGYKPTTKEIYDVGLNYMVGSKWPHKAMPVDMWKELESQLGSSGYNISWQQGTDDLHKYMDWIHSCKIIITNDSLGLHIAFAFKKKVIGLFGPTDAKEIYFYEKGKVISPRVKCDYMPCYKTRCRSGKKCMEKVNVKNIVDSIKEFDKEKGLVRQHVA